MGRKRDLKNVHAKRPPSFNPEDPDDLNEWGGGTGADDRPATSAQRASQAGQVGLSIRYG